MKLTLGPIPYFWDRQTVYAFYEQVMASPFDTVALGETVCSKRRQLSRNDWLDIARTLQACGKHVMVSTLALIEAESELGSLRTLCQEAQALGLMIEANDYAAVNLLSKAGVEFAGGASLNLYNAQSVQLLRGMGLVRWQPPLELSKDQIQLILSEQQAGLETDLFVWGHMTLAYSARCYTARAHDIAKDECGFVCLQHPQGLSAASQDGLELFTLNGIQTQSGKPLDLLDAWDEAGQIGITGLRLAADSFEVLNIASTLREAILEGRPLKRSEKTDSCNGYWNHIAGMQRV